jgi:hypothetical protein
MSSEGARGCTLILCKAVMVSVLTKPCSTRKTGLKAIVIKYDNVF